MPIEIINHQELEQRP